MKKKLMVMIPIGIGAIAIFTFVGGTAVKLLWNWLLPPLFGWPQITFWQAIGLLALCRILFGGVGGRGGYRSTMRRRMADRMAERWSAMTPEERARFRQGMRGSRGCGDASRPGASG